MKPLLPLALQYGVSGGIETWWISSADATGGDSLDLRFQLLHSHNGFHRLCETVAFVSRRDQQRPVAARQTLPLSEFSTHGSEGVSTGSNDTFDVRLGSNRLSAAGSIGEVSSKGQTIRWQLQFREAPTSDTWSLVPQPWPKLPITWSRDCSWQSPFEIDGFCEWNGRRTEFRGARGFLRHAFAQAMGLEWTRLEAPTFLSEQGAPSDVHVEAFRVPLCTRFGKALRPTHTLFRFRYQGRDYITDSLWKSIRSRSEFGGTDWNFRSDHGELSFRGQVQSEIRDFTGTTLEDTDGSLTYPVQTRRARCTLRVYRRDKLEASFVSKGPVLFEFARSERNPYVDFQF